MERLKKTAAVTVMIGGILAAGAGTAAADNDDISAGDQSFVAGANLGDMTASMSSVLEPTLNFLSPHWDNSTQR
jgi:hypothetical protein